MRHLCAALLLSAATSSATLAEAQTYYTEYAVSALGIPVGRTSFNTLIEADAYALKGALKSNGLISLFSPISANVAVSGRIAKAGPRASRFALDYRSGDDDQVTEIEFADGSVSRVTNEPEPRKGDDWLEVTQAHLRGTLDPLSAMLVKAPQLSKVCGRTLRVFDGWMRADLKLDYLRTIPFSATGFKGDAVTCRVKFLPISGYRESKEEVAWMRDKANIEISFAPVAGTSLFAPVFAEVETEIGQIRLRATRFEAVGSGPLEIGDR